MDVSTYLAIARRWWWTLLVATWAAGLTSFLAAQNVPERYEAQTKLLVGPLNADRNTLQGASQIAQTYAELVETTPILRKAADSVGLGSASTDQLREAVSARANEVTRFLVISAQGSDPTTAASLANALQRELLATSADNPVGREGRLTVQEVAEEPSRPISPDISLIVLFATGAGFIGSLVLVVVFELLSNTVATRRDVEEAGDVPFLGTASVARNRRGAREPLLVEAWPESRAAVSHRLVAGKILFSEQGKEPKSVLVLGAQPGDGAPEFAANLAAVLAATGRSTLLVDANDLSARITEMFSFVERPGLTELLQWSRGSLPPEAIERVALRRPPGIEIVTRGAVASQLVNARDASAVLEVLTTRYEVVILNAAPVHRSGSALVWARIVDGVLVTAHRDVTKRENLAFAMESLRLVGARVIGTVLLEPFRGVFGRRAVTPAPEAPGQEQPAVGGGGGRAPARRNRDEDG